MSKVKEVNDEASHVGSDSKESQICGIVMPISSIDGCTESHWSEVREIITQCIEEAGFTANLVSNSDEIGVIQKRIIQNLYENPIIICDVSAKNPNVMFELGLRLAFDRPTVIIKDNVTSYSFDTSPIEHLEYPRDLRYSVINDFKKKLIEKIKNTYNASKNDPHYSTFLRHFGEFKVAKINTKEVAPQELVLDEIKTLRNMLYSVIKERNAKEESIIKNYELIRKEARLNRLLHDELTINIVVKLKEKDDYRKIISDMMSILGSSAASNADVLNGNLKIKFRFPDLSAYENAKQILNNKSLPYQYSII